MYLRKIIQFSLFSKISHISFSKLDSLFVFVNIFHFVLYNVYTMILFFVIKIQDV